jgi:hypothetical protein
VYQAGADRVWDEMLKIVELGDGTNRNPWRLGVYQDRRLYYGMESTTPVGYVSGGVRWRVDGPDDIINYTVVRYTNVAGAAQTDILTSINESVLLYGRRMEVLTRSNMPTASATVLGQQYLYEHGWPYMRAVGCGRDIQIYDGIGCNNAKNGWTVQPGVFQDTTFTGGSNYYYSWLPEPSMFLADEVVASENGVQLRTSKWSDLDALEAYYKYIGKKPKKRKKKKK